MPDACDVCKYAAEHDRDVENEHALTRIATAILIEDLEDLGYPAPMSSLAVTTFPAVGEVIHILEPRHWHWAVLHEPTLLLGLRGDAS